MERRYDTGHAALMDEMSQLFKMFHRDIDDIKKRRVKNVNRKLQRRTKKNVKTQNRR